MPDLLPLLRAELARARTQAAPLDDVPWLVADGAPLPRVAIVAADAGNVQLRLAPLRLAMVRVSSSSQDAPIGELVFSLDADPDELATALREALPTLTAPLEGAGIDLEARLVAGRERRDPVSSVRELLEWAAVLVEVGRDGPPSLIVRDGLLRSIFLDAPTYGRLATAIEAACARTGHRLAAVAKSLPGGRDLTNRLLLGGVFDRRPAARTAWIEIPRSVERALLPAAFVDGRRMGPLLLVWHALTGRLVAVEVARAHAAPVVGFAVVAGVRRGRVAVPALWRADEAARRRRRPSRAGGGAGVAARSSAPHAGGRGVGGSPGRATATRRCVRAGGVGARPSRNKALARGGVATRNPRRGTSWWAGSRPAAPRCSCT